MSLYIIMCCATILCSVFCVCLLLIVHFGIALSLIFSQHLHLHEHFRFKQLMDRGIIIFTDVRTRERLTLRMRYGSRTPSLGTKKRRAAVWSRWLCLQKVRGDGGGRLVGYW